MKSNKSWAAVVRVLAVVAVTLIVTLVFASSVWVAEYAVLHKFAGGTDGSSPRAGLIFDGDGNLYGTTESGGGTKCGGIGCGTVFKLTPNPDGSWKESVLYSFSGEPADGSQPEAEVTFDMVGNLYGTTQWGGAQNYGTVYKLTPNPDGSWTESLIHTFLGGTDGFNPTPLTFDAEGNLYGATKGGGDVGHCKGGCGTVFRLVPNLDDGWTKSVLYSFRGEDGMSPVGGLIFDAVGNLYGTTAQGGHPYNQGTAFKLTPQPDGSWKRTKLHVFKGPDGAWPSGRLVLDVAGNVYGTTSAGGFYNGGTAFKLTPNPDGSWDMSKLHAFKEAGYGYERAPNGGLILDANGNLYGTTWGGTVYKLTPNPDGSWKLARLHTFRKQHPYAGLVMDAAGILYGTTYLSGPDSYGEVFNITP